MLWLGANPTADVPSDPYQSDDTNADDDPRYRNALVTALWRGKFEVFKQLPIDKTKVSLDFLLDRAAFGRNADAIHRLIAMGANPNAEVDDGNVLHTALSSAIWGCEPGLAYGADSREGGVAVVKALLEHGAKFVAKGHRSIADLRRRLLRCDSSSANRIVTLLRAHGGMTPEQLKELLRTEAIQRHLRIAAMVSSYGGMSPEVRAQRHAFMKYRGSSFR